jgi:cobalt/nickel transport protein
MNAREGNWIGLAGVVLVVFALVAYGSRRTRSLVGSDEKACAAIVAVHPDYQPWFEPLWQPSGALSESALFALQAALGAGLVGYAIRSMARKPTTERSMDA